VVLRPGAGVVELAGADGCHTSVQGEECYGSVVWQMTSRMGVTEHPELNSGLTKDSSFEDFQAWVHKQNPGVCREPCQPKGTSDAPGKSIKKAEAKAKAKKKDADEVDADCHTSTKGEACHTSVTWAMSDGIFAHPEWYDGLTKSSEFENFQAAIHRLDASICPQPCSPSHLTKKTVEVVSSAGSSAGVFSVSVESPGGHCKDPIPGDACYADVEWARHIGIYLHPEWYDPLTQEATRKEFQMVVHHRNESACPPPCGLNSSSLVLAKNESQCKTAVEGDECYDSVTWAMHDGMDMHPEWYSGLSKNSTFEEFQAAVHRLRPGSCAPPCRCHTAASGEACYREVEKETDGKMDPHSRYQAQLLLHRAGHGECGFPCKEVRPKGSPSLYCFSVVSRFNPEELHLIETQRSLKASIFDCDEFAVLSTSALDMGDDVSTLIFPDAAVGVSNAGTAANAEIFMNAWEAIRSDGRWADYDWVVKTDPDAVLMPKRLRRHLALHRGKEGVYLKNCDRYGGPSLFGALEAFSHAAVRMFFDSGPECRNTLNWQEWGEDVFMALCLDHIGVSSVFDQKLIGDARCTWADCGDGTSSSYHPFKSVGDWTSCWERASNER
jgi:hypothetical protein